MSHLPREGTRATGTRKGPAGVVGHAGDSDLSNAVAL
jgi:hypothetical protein